MTSERELLPCPFCHADLEQRNLVAYHPETMCWMSGYSVPANEFDRWNTRASPPSQPERGEAVEQVISAWAFAHNIDGATRNDLFARLRAQPSPATDADVERALNWLRRATADERELQAADLIEAQAAKIEAMRVALSGIKWKSIDRDNMEFAATITYSQMDCIRAALQPQEPSRATDQKS